VIQSEISQDFDSMAKRAEREYIEAGNPAPLVVFLSYNLARAGIDMRSAEQIIGAIVERDRIPRYVFDFEKRVLLERRKRNRIEKLNLLKEKLKSVGDINGNR